MRETAYAKVNLALHVRGREANGYHRIETVFAFCEDGDILCAAPGDGLSLAVTGPFAADLAGEDDNLVLRAARAVAEQAGIAANAALTLDKRLPVASGIGGGSADAAAALRLLQRFWALELAERDVQKIAVQLGADVPACLTSRSQRGEGRGDVLTAFVDGDVSGTPILLVNPRVPLSTAAVFRAWDGEDRGALVGWREGRNDLEAPAKTLAPQIGEVLATLSGTRITRMSGSGATCFALFERAQERDAAAAAIGRARPDWWTLASRLR